MVPSFFGSWRCIEDGAIERYNGTVASFLRFFYNQALPCLLVTVGILGIWLLSRSMEPVTYDWLMQRTAVHNHARLAAVNLLILDPASTRMMTARFGPAPWTASQMKQLLAPVSAANPVAIVIFDMLFNPPTHSSKDAIPPHWLWRLPTSDVAGQLPPAHCAQEAPVWLDSGMADGVLRTLQPAQILADHHLHLNLAFKAVIRYLERESGLSGPWHLQYKLQPGLESQQLVVFPKKQPDLSLKIPVDESGRYLLRWFKPETLTAVPHTSVSHPATTLRTFLQWPVQQQKAWLSHKIVILAQADPALNTTVATSVSPRQLGADVYATAMTNLLNNQTLTRAPGWLRSLCLLLAFFAAFFLRVRFVSFGRSLLYSAALMAGYFWLTLLALIKGGLVLDIVTPEVFILLGLVAGTVWWSTNRDRQLKSLETALSQLVAPSVLQEIRRHKTGLQPGGQRLEITSFFVDIRDFTALAENLPAMEVTALLNAFYTEVEQVIFRHRGTIDKYMGDGVLVMFGAPLADSHHAETALAAAVDLRHALLALAAQWWQQRQIHFDIGISIHSGHAYVGFVGPLNKLEYTALGDTVNLAVRFQELNKRLNVRVVLSEQTVRYCRLAQCPALHSLGLQKIRGRETAIAILTFQDEVTAFSKYAPPHDEASKEPTDVAG